MFTGIVESIGIIKEILTSGDNKTFWIESPLAKELKPDQSVSHNGVCLTIEEVKKDWHRVTAISETLTKSNFDDSSQGDLVNLERCLQMNGRLDGHIVQGHVDTVGACIGKKELSGSLEFRINFPTEFAEFVIEKGSISVNGISLTAFSVTDNEFSIAIIPYTLEHTNIRLLKPGEKVNLEFDIIGKYIQRIIQLNDKKKY